MRNQFNDGSKYVVDALAMLARREKLAESVLAKMMTFQRADFKGAEEGHILWHWLVQDLLVEASSDPIQPSRNKKTNSPKTTSDPNFWSQLHRDRGKRVTAFHRTFRDYIDKNAATHLSSDAPRTLLQNLLHGLSIDGDLSAVSDLNAIEIEDWIDAVIQLGTWGGNFRTIMPLIKNIEFWDLCEKTSPGHRLPFVYLGNFTALPSEKGHLQNDLESFAEFFAQKVSDNSIKPRDDPHYNYFSLQTLIQTGSNSRTVDTVELFPLVITEWEKIGNVRWE